MEFKDVGVVISGIALFAAFINNVVQYLNTSTIDQVLMNTKDRNAAVFYKMIITFLTFLFFLFYLIYQITIEKNLIVSLISAFGLIIITIIWFSYAFKDYLYFLNENNKPSRIVSRIDNNHLLIAYRENNNINNKIISVDLIENKNLYVSKRTLLDKDYTIRQINKKLKIN